MRNIILGTVAGLIVGTLGSLAYTEYFGDASQVADLKAQLDAANTKLAKAEADAKFLKEQNNSETDQLNQVLASKQQQDTGDKSQTSGPAPTPLTVGGVQITPDMIRGFLSMTMRGGGPGGFRSPEQRMFLLQNRLKLDPDQAKAIKAAMDADQQARREAFRQARQNGQPPDPAALAAANTLDKTLSSVLSPTQQVQYQQLQSDEKQARAESAATSQVDNMMPLLQLTDDQKEKAMNALYQQQLSAPDAGSLATNPNPLAVLAQQGQAAQTAMKQVLTPDQYALYQQDQQVQSQAFGNFGGRRGNNNGGGGGNGGNNAPVTASVSTGGQTTTMSGTMTTTTPGAAATDTTTSATNTPSATTPDNSASTNAPSATTNAAAATPPAGN